MPRRRSSGTDVEIQSGTTIRTFVRILPAVATFIAIGVGISFFLTNYLPGVVPPSEFVVSGSPQTAIWELNDATEFSFDGTNVEIAAGRAQLKLIGGWWNANYRYRVPLTITAGPAGATAGQTVVLTSPTSLYVNLGLMQTDRDDLRIIYWDGNTNTELDRDYVSVTDLRFKLQSPITPGASTGAYFMYLGNASATNPPANRANVYEYFQDFSTDVFGAGTWTSSSNPAVCTTAFSVSGGRLQKGTYSPGDCFAWDNTSTFSAADDWVIESDLELSSGVRPVVGSLALHDDAGTGGYWAGLTENATDTVFIRNSAGTFVPSATTTAALGTTYRVTWRYDYTTATNRTHTVFVNGTQALQANDTAENFSLGTGKFGVHNYNPFDGSSTPGVIAWDNYKAWRETSTVAVGSLQGGYPQTAVIASATGLPYGSLTAFSIRTDDQRLVAFQLSSDDGATWLYTSDGVNWIPSNGTFAQSSGAALVNFAAPSFPNNGTLRWRAVFSSYDVGASQHWLDQVAFGFTYDAADLDADGYTSVASGGNDCVDSVQALYKDGVAGCDESQTTLNYPGIPIVDHTIVKDDVGTYHIFFSAGAPTEIRHYSTTDLTQPWADEGIALRVAPGAWDPYGLWAPHVIRKDGTWYMFYTGSTGAGNADHTERLGLATSTDLTNWTRYPINNCSGSTGDGCVYTCNETWTTVSLGGPQDEQCRDPMVLFDPKTGQWDVFLTAVGLASGTHVTTVATSSDLLSWTGLGYISSTGLVPGGVGKQTGGGIAENPFVTQYDSDYYLFFTDWNDPQPAIQYVKSPTLTFDSSGSANWAYQGDVGVTGLSAPEVTVLENDTWLFTASDGPLGTGNWDLRLLRMVWDNAGGFSLVNFTGLDCRVPSDSIHPDATEVCGDSIDNNCSAGDGEVLFCGPCTDLDGDGYGSPASYACSFPQLDCNDAVSTINPGGAEICDSQDNNCSGETDEGGICVSTSTCTPSWQCGAWSVCSENVQTRTCTDLNSCGVDTGKPPVSRACASPAACVEDWGCTPWSACSAEGVRTRTCTDRNACGTITDRPAESERCGVGGPSSSDENPFLAVGPNAGRPPLVRLFTPEGALFSQFQAYGDELRKHGGVQLAIGDVDGDGRSDILTGTPSGRRPLLRLFDQDGVKLHEFHPYSPRSKLGVTVAAGDVDGDGIDEVFVTPASGAAATVRMYRYEPDRPWFRYDKSFSIFRNYRQGLSLAFADVDGDDRDEMILSTVGRSTPRIHIYDYDLTKQTFEQKRSFLSFTRSHRLGVVVAAGDVDGDGEVEIVASSGPGGAPHIRIFSAAGKLEGQFFAASTGFREGAYPATLDVDGDGDEEILTVVNRRGAPGVLIFQRQADNTYSRYGSFQAFPRNYNTGLRMSTP